MYSLVKSFSWKSIRMPLLLGFPFHLLEYFIGCINNSCLFAWSIGRGEGIFRCPWAGREPSGRRAPGDDRAKCDRMPRRIKNRDLWWPELALPHPLWPKTECLPVSWTGLHHRRATQEEEDRIAAPQPAESPGILALPGTLNGGDGCRELLRGPVSFFALVWALII